MNHGYLLVDWVFAVITAPVALSVQSPLFIQNCLSLWKEVLVLVMGHITQVKGGSGLMSHGECSIVLDRSPTCVK